jgi:DNA-binding transcriptional LysR family regulator
LSFSRAANACGSRSLPLSRAVKQLEHALDAQVLERTRHRDRLTPAGAVLLRDTGHLLQQVEEVARRVRRTASGEEGELRLGYIGPPTQPFLGRLLHDYRQRYPRVSIHLEERTPERVWEMVARGRLSAALTAPWQCPKISVCARSSCRKKGSELWCRKVIHWRGAVPRRGRHSPANPSSFLARREGMGLHDAVIAGCRRAGVTPRLAHTPSLIGTVMSYVEAGAGLGVATESVVTPSPALHFVC